MPHTIFVRGLGARRPGGKTRGPWRSRGGISPARTSAPPVAAGSNSRENSALGFSLGNAAA